MSTKICITAFVLPVSASFYRGKHDDFTPTDSRPSSQNFEHNPQLLSALTDIHPGGRTTEVASHYLPEVDTTYSCLEGMPTDYTLLLPAHITDTSSRLQALTTTIHLNNKA